MAGLDLLFLFVVAAVGLVALVVWLSHQRRKALEAVAQRLGLRFTPDAMRLDEALKDLEATSAGSARRLVNEMRGDHKGRPVRCFDFRYTTQNGKNQSTRYRGVAVTEVPRSWPRLRIVPEHIGHKLADALGADDIDFESQEFSDRFWVRSPDRKFAYDVIDPRMMDFLMQPGLARWEIRDGLLCIWREGAWKPEEIPAALDRLVAFVERVPRHVWARAEAAP